MKIFMQYYQEKSPIKPFCRWHFPMNPESAKELANKMLFWTMEWEGERAFCEQRHLKWHLPCNEIEHLVCQAHPKFQEPFYIFLSNLIYLSNGDVMD